MLGRGRLTVELCLLKLLVPVVVATVCTVDTLALLGDRTTGWCVRWKLPDCRESDGRGTLILVADEAVWVVKPDGNCTGRVGDLGFGLTNPMPFDGNDGMGAGFLVDDCALVRPGVAWGVAGFAGLVGVLTVIAGDFMGGFVLALAVDIVLGALFWPVVAVVLCTSLLAVLAAATFGRSGRLVVAAAAVRVCSATGGTSLALLVGMPLEEAGGAWLALPFVGGFVDFLGLSGTGRLLAILSVLTTGFSAGRAGDMSFGILFAWKILPPAAPFCSLTPRNGVLA